MAAFQQLIVIPRSSVERQMDNPRPAAHLGWVNPKRRLSGFLQGRPIPAADPAPNLSADQAKGEALRQIARGIKPYAMYLDKLVWDYTRQRLAESNERLHRIYRPVRAFPRAPRGGPRPMVVEMEFGDPPQAALELNGGAEEQRRRKRERAERDRAATLAMKAKGVASRPNPNGGWGKDFARRDKKRQRAA